LKVRFLMDTLQDIRYQRSMRRWRLGWIIVSISSLTLVLLALADSMYGALQQIDGTVDTVMTIIFFTILFISLYSVFINNRILRQMQRTRSELPPGFYNLITEKDYCSNCGLRLAPEAKYCKYCGKQV